MRPLIVYGTRPEYIKLKPVIDAFNQISYPIDILQVGQHQSKFIGSNKGNDVGITSQVENRLNAIQCSIMGDFTLNKDKTNLVIVQGDTSTALGAALNSFNSEIPVAHVEAGLRSHDFQNPYPEEMYRCLIDKISTLHFCPRESEFLLLRSEGINTDNAWVTGNTVIDYLPWYPISDNRNKVLITMHRRENKPLLNEWLDKFDTLAKNYNYSPKLKFEFIKHPSNPEIKFENIEIIEPLGRGELLKKLAREVKIVITDSGGVQEECSHYNIPVIVCRKVTERPYEGSIICSNPFDIYKIYSNMTYEFKTKWQGLDTRGTFGDGNAGKRIVEHITNYLK